MSQQQQQATPNDCPICLDALGTAGRAEIKTGCGHAFHLECLVLVGEKTANPTCPLCRGNIDQVRSLYTTKQQQQQQQQQQQPSYGSIPTSGLPPGAFSTNMSSGYGTVPMGYGALPQTNNSVPFAMQSMQGFSPYGGVSSSASDKSAAQRICSSAASYARAAGADDSIDEAALKQAAAAAATLGEQTPVKLTGALKLERSEMACGDAGSMFGVLSLAAPEVDASTALNAQSAAEAPPIDLLVVFDKSGSMSGSKIELVKHTLKFVVSQLKPSDRICLVEFQSSASVIAPFTRCSDDKKTCLNQTISKVSAGGGTNISLGVAVGLEMFRRREKRNALSSMLVLTDGQDGSMRTIDGVFEQYADQTRQLACHSFGFGRDHDARVMNKIAEITRGTFTYIENLDAVGPAFALTLGSLTSVAAVQIEAKLDVSESAVAAGYALSKLHTKFEHTVDEQGASATITLPDIQWGESRDVVFELTCPVRSEPATDVPLNASASYNELSASDADDNNANGKSAVQIAIESLALARPSKVVDADASINIDVVVQRNRVCATTAIDLASDLAQQNDLAGARESIDAALQEIRASAAAADPTSKILLNDLADVRKRLEPAAYKASNGYGYLRQAANTHWQQRQTYNDQGNAGAYGTVAQSNMMSNYTPMGI